MKPILKSSLVVEPINEVYSTEEHAEKQNVNTTVLHLYEKYRTGKIDDMPQSALPVLPDDNRSDDEMLNDRFIPGLGTEQVDVINYYAELRESLDKDFKALTLSKTNAKKYKDALSVIDNPQSSPAARSEAYQTIEAIRNSARAD